MGWYLTYNEDEGYYSVYEDKDEVGYMTPEQAADFLAVKVEWDKWQDALQMMERHYMTEMDRLKAEKEERALFEKLKAKYGDS